MVPTTLTLKREPERLRNLFEVVEFGRKNYLFDTKNNQQNYITLRTLKNKTEMTRWGSNIADEIKREGVKVGSVIKMRKEGETTVKVLLLMERAISRDGQITSAITGASKIRGQWGSNPRRLIG